LSIDGGNVRRRRKLFGQLVLVGRIARHETQHEIVRTPRHMALAHLGPGADHLLEAGQYRIGLVVEPDQREEADFEAQGLAFKLGVIAFDEAGILQRAHAAQARWRRDPRAAR
jgi:hypothetical protein